MINKYKPITMNQNKFISSEEGFPKLNTDNIKILTPKSTTTGRGTWVTIRYDYGDGKVLPLKIQTSEVFSYGISKFDENAPNKISLCMHDRNLRDKNEDILTEDEKLDIKMEDMTVKILDDITAKIKDLLMEQDFIKALGKKMNDVKWAKGVSEISIVKRNTLANGSESVYVYAKVIDTDNFMKSNFFEIDDDSENGLVSVNQKDTIEKLSRSDCNCKVTAMLTIDSIFIGVGTAPYLQVKLAEAVIGEYIIKKQMNNILLPVRTRNKSRQAVIITDSDSDSDNEIMPKQDKQIIEIS
jgi:hypothetical protein